MTWFEAHGVTTISADPAGSSKSGDLPAAETDDRDPPPSVVTTGVPATRSEPFGAATLAPGAPVPAGCVPVNPGGALGWQAATTPRATTRPAAARPRTRVDPDRHTLTDLSQLVDRSRRAGRRR